MSPRASFLAAIKAQPDDDTVRLVYADWLDEQDNERDARQAEMIRFQIELARTRHNHAPKGGARRAGTGPQCPRCRMDRIDRLNWQSWARCLVPADLPGQFLFRRGFVASAFVYAHEWLYHSAELLAHHPIGQLMVECLRPLPMPPLAASVASVPRIAFARLPPGGTIFMAQCFDLGRLHLFGDLDAHHAPALESFFGRDAATRHFIRRVLGR